MAIFLWRPFSPPLKKLLPSSKEWIRYIAALFSLQLWQALGCFCLAWYLAIATIRHVTTSLLHAIAVSPALKWLEPGQANRFGLYLDSHCGAILGNVFFGMYLGLMGNLEKLTGLPIEIRHVAFSSANLGTALEMLDISKFTSLFLWTLAGVLGIALVNLFVSFSLALYVAMKSKSLGLRDLAKLGRLLARRFLRDPLAFFTPPDPLSGSEPP